MTLTRARGARRFAEAARKSLEIEGRSFVVYQYEADKVQRDGPASAPPPQVPAAARRQRQATKGISVDFAADEHSQPWLPLPPVPDSIVDGEHYVCVKVDFALSMPEWGSLHWTAMVEVDTLAVALPAAVRRRGHRPGLRRRPDHDQRRPGAERHELGA